DREVAVVAVGEIAPGGDLGGDEVEVRGGGHVAPLSAGRSDRGPLRRGSRSEGVSLQAVLLDRRFGVDQLLRPGALVPGRYARCRWGSSATRRWRASARWPWPLPCGSLATTRSTRALPTTH